MSEPAETMDGFDFENYGNQAIQKYRDVLPFHEKFAEVIRRIFVEAFSNQNIKIHSIEARAKNIESFVKKARMPSDSDPNKPRYLNPLLDITDLTGVRVIAFFPRTLKAIDFIIRKQFDVIEMVDKDLELQNGEKLGYGSIHYLIRLKKDRANLPEYSKFNELIAEVQIRTILQHAWAEIEHDIQYKAVETTSKLIRRRFLSLAGMLEIADREFQAIQDEDERLKEEARQSVREGKLEQVEITSDALKAYLDNKLGPDGRMSDFSYRWGVKLLRGLGFGNFKDIDECIKVYNDNQIDEILWHKRQGQLTRFENLLLAGMGENFTKHHVWKNEDWFITACERRLKILRDANIPIGSFLSPDFV